MDILAALDTLEAPQIPSPLTNPHWDDRELLPDPGMHVYLAGGQVNWPESFAGQNVLLTFAETRHMDGMWRACRAAKEAPLHVLLDSGAFAVWRRGQSIDLDGYMRFIDRHIDILDGYFALDVIPGAPGRLPTADEAKRASDQSVDNWERMRFLGFDPIPIYHEGENEAVLWHYWMMVQSDPYSQDVIGLGATASRGKTSLAEWLVPIFDQLHRPGCEFPKFHGLAMTQERSIKNIPFYSVDSTSWMNLGRYGPRANLYILRRRSRQFYDQVGHLIGVESLANRIAMWGPEHLVEILEKQDRNTLNKIGIACLYDFARCSEDATPTKNGQLALF
jgi:hypothetical protein